MEVAIGRYLAHGTGGHFSRWFDDVRFHFQQTVSALGGDDFDNLSIDLMMPGPQGDFGPPSVSLKLRTSKRKMEAVLCLDPTTYGAASTSDARIRLLIEGLADLAKLICIEVGESELADEFWMRVYLLQDEILRDA